MRTTLPKIARVMDSQTLKIFPEFDYRMQFDGCSKANPGLAGAGAVIYHCGKEYWANHFFVGEHFTNNHAEYAGLIMGLQQAHEFDITRLYVEGDSQLVINQMKGVYKCRSENLLELYERAKDLASSFEEIEFAYIPREKNQRADQLANIAVEQHLMMKDDA